MSTTLALVCHHCGQPFTHVQVEFAVELDGHRYHAQCFGPAHDPFFPDHPPTERSTVLRQGDILLVPVSEIPDGLKEVPKMGGRMVLAEGEATGHAHVIEGEAQFLATDLEDLEGRFLRVEQEAELVHDEHSTITVPPGEYEVRRQREYDGLEEQFVSD